MTKETMTIHKALTELKILQDRITSTMGETVFCVANKHSNTKIKGVSIPDMISNMNSSLNKVNDLIARRTAIKRGIVFSNATTKININNKEMTIAEAIELKNHGIEFESALLNRMEVQYALATKECDKYNAGLSDKAETYITNLYGQKESRPNTEEVQKALELYMVQNTFEIIQSLDTAKEIETRRNAIDAFLSEVDSAISTSNALTTITIEY